MIGKPTVLARAKVNLGLEVLGRRPDGYHEVRTILATVSLADRLEAVPAPRLQVRSNRPELGSGSDLVFRAAQAVMCRAGLRAGALIRVEKRIPLAAGLGGGASDAAATLRLLRRLFRLRSLSEADLYQLGATLGADVPFFIRGGVALAAGRGERLEPLPDLPPWPVIVALDREGPPDKTRRAYAALTPDHWSAGEEVLKIAEELVGSRWSAAEAPFNVFDLFAPQLYPDIDGLKARVLRAGARWVSLAGAGPAIFTVEPDPDRARTVSRNLRVQGIPAFLCHFSPRLRKL